MTCPACSAENIAGVDLCVQCGSSLMQPPAESTGDAVGDAIMRDEMAGLIPADPLVISPDTTVREAVQHLVESGRNCCLVVEDQRMVGILTERDLLTRVALKWGECATKPVREFMTPDPERVRPTDSIAFGLNRMLVGDYRHVPIERDGQALGVVSVRHILGYIAKCYPDILT